jgi:hypothetical protein
MDAEFTLVSKSRNNKKSKNVDKNKKTSSVTSVKSDVLNINKTSIPTTPASISITPTVPSTTSHNIKPRKYSLDEFNKIRQNMNIQIPQVIVDKIKIIYTQTMRSKEEYYSKLKNTDTRSFSSNTLNITRNEINNTTQKHTTHYSNSVDGRKNNTYNKNKELSDEDWEKMRNFKITQKDKKNGLDKLYDDIRSLLNKLTYQTTDIITDILNIIKSAVESNTHTYTDFYKIIEYVIEIVSSNSFYSKLYVWFLCSLIKINYAYYDWINDNICTLFSPLYDIEINSNDIRIGNSEKDYDEFCRLNKENEKRRNLATLYCDILFNPEFYSFPKEGEEEGYKYAIMNTFDMLFKYYELFLQYGENEDTKEECAEACELFCILYNCIMTYINTDDHTDPRSLEIIYNKVCVRLIEITKMNKKQLKETYPGIINKTLFKLMDIKLNLVYKTY